VLDTIERIFLDDFEVFNLLVKGLDIMGTVLNFLNQDNLSAL
jgi:hypothetical protein